MNELNEYELRKLFPRASGATIKANISHTKSEGETPKLECDSSPGTLAKIEVKERDSRRCEVRITSIRKRLIDTDNLSGKYHVDALRYSGILHVDSPDKTTITTTQKKCEKDEEEFIEITITYL